MISTASRFGKLFKFIIITVIVIVLVLALTPLNLYYSHVENYLRPIKLNGISGSVVKGQAKQLSYMSMPMGEAEWLLYPRSYDALAGEIRVNKTNYDLKFNIRKISQDDVDVKSIRGYLDWGLIKPFVQMRYGQLSGYADFDLSQLQYNKHSGLERLSGKITLKDFKMLKPAMKDLGQVELSFETKSKGMIAGTFSSDSNVLNVSGSLFLQSNRWQLNLDIIPKGGHFELDAILNSVGDARRGGGRRLNLAGFY